MIIFYEDEQDTIKYELEYLSQKEIETKCFDRADELLNFYEQNYKDIDLIIIDIMVFGPGNDFGGKDTDDGFLSGVVLVDELEKIEKGKNEIKKNKIIYTNRNRDDLISSLHADKRIILVKHKNKQFFDQFVDQVIEHIKR